MIRRAILISCMCAVTVVTSGCVSISTGKKQAAVPADGGVFKSIDGGRIWRQRAAVAAVPKPKSIATANIASWALDPTDDRTIYYSAVGGGLYYTLDEGESWFFVTPLGNASIRSIAVDPNDRCRLYAAAGNLLWRSADCARSWARIYTDNDATAAVTAVAIDPDQPGTVYLGLSRGDVLRSTNAGESWQQAAALKDRVQSFLIDPNDKETVYAITEKKGIFRSAAGGWTDPFTKALKDVKLSTAVREFVLVPGDATKLYVATDRAIAVSDDKGATWKVLPDILPDKSATINAFAVNFQNQQELWFVTNTNFYRSADAGATWTPAKLPSTRRGWDLLVKPSKPSTVYLAVRAVEKK